MTAIQIGEAARKVLLNCLRAYWKRQQIYCNDLEKQVIALSKGCTTTNQVMKELHDLDGLACLGEPRPAPGADAIALENLFLREVMAGPKQAKPAERGLA